jgi:hypothetical protein
VDLHRLNEERSIEYHRFIAERLLREPEILDMARRRVAEWLAARKTAPFYARKWAEILAADADSVAAFLVDRGELATELRQSTPFAGAISPQERRRIWRETRERFPYSNQVCTTSSGSGISWGLPMRTRAQVFQRRMASSLAGGRRSIAFSKCSMASRNQA